MESVGPAKVNLIMTYLDHDRAFQRELPRTRSVRRLFLFYTNEHIREQVAVQRLPMLAILAYTKCAVDKKFTKSISVSWNLDGEAQIRPTW